MSADSGRRVATVFGNPAGVITALIERFARTGALAVHLAPNGATSVFDASGQLSFPSLSPHPPGAREAVEWIVEQLGAISVWVNVLRARPGSRADLLPERELTRELEALTEIFTVTQAAARTMFTRGGGVVVNVGSVLAFEAVEGCAASSVAASGLVATTRSLAIEWAPRGIRVVGVAVFDPEACGGHHDPTRRVPLRRTPTDADVTDAVLYLAGDQASYIVGETLRVDGGWAAYHLF